VGLNNASTALNVAEAIKKDQENPKDSSSTKARNELIAITKREQKVKKGWKATTQR